MAAEKHNLEVRSDKTDESRVEELPPYEVEAGAGSSGHGPSSSTSGTRNPEKAPTISSPFTFPTEIPAPAYTESSKPIQRPIAIPQSVATPTAPFLQAYAPILLAHGVPPETWASFLDTLSAFLAAKVTDRAISHAGDIAKHVGNAHKRFGKNVAAHAKDIGRNITDCAKKGNLVGAAFGVIGGAISLPLSTAANAVGAVVSLPGIAVSAVTTKPQTPRERAMAYTAVANKDWFGPRRLCAQLMDTHELSQLLGVPSSMLLEAPLSKGATDAHSQLGALKTYISELTINECVNLRLGGQTLWLVVTKDSDN